MKNNLSNKDSNTHIFCTITISLFVALLNSSAMASEKSPITSTAEDTTNFVVTKSLHSLSISACIKDTCRAITPPQDMLNSIKNGYSKVTVEDLTLDGSPEIVLTHEAEGSVNACSKVYQYNSAENSFTYLDSLPKQLCNYAIKNNYLVSSYKNNAKWHEDIYKIENNKLLLKISDNCIGCDYISRTIYLPKDKTDHTLVTNNLDYTLRTQLSTSVISMKAMLYQEPNENSITKMYLIRDDKVALTDFTVTKSDDFWYQIRYTTKKGGIIKAWLKCDDIKYCAQ